MTRRPDAGNATVGMVIVVPVLVMLAVLIVGLGRTVAAQQSVTGAARAAARAASLADTPSAAASTAARVAAAALHGECETVTTTPEVAGFRPGGRVTVDVSCVASLSGVAIAGLPGHTTLRASATSPVEQFRRIR